MLIFPCVLHNIGYPIGCLCFREFLFSSEISKDDFLLVLLVLDELFGLILRQFWEVDVPVPVVEGGNNPIPSFIVVFGLRKNLLDLILGQEHGADPRHLLYFNLLYSDCVKKFFFLAFMLLSNVPDLLKVLDVFLFDFLEPDPHFFHLLVERFVVLFHRKKLIFPFLPLHFPFFFLFLLSF